MEPKEGRVGHNALLLVFAGEWEDGLSAAQVDKTVWRCVWILQDIGEEGGDELVEESLGRVDVQLGIEDHAGFIELFCNCLIPADPCIVGERMGGEEWDEKGVAVRAKLAQAVHYLQVLHPVNDDVLVALLCDVHLFRHAVVEQLCTDDGE